MEKEVYKIASAKKKQYEVAFRKGYSCLGTSLSPYLFVLAAQFDNFVPSQKYDLKDTCKFITI